MVAGAAPLLAAATRHYTVGAFAEAETLCRQAQGLAPGDPGVAHLLGLCLLAQGRIDVGAALLEAALALQPGNDGIRLHLAQVHALRGRHQAVVELLDGVVQRRPDLAEACRPLAAALWELNDRQGAIRVYRALVARRPGDRQAVQGLASALLQCGEGKEAVGLLRLVVAMEPAGAEERDEAMVLLAEALAQAARACPAGGPEDAEAAAAARAALALDPGDPVHRMRLAVVLRHAEALDEAVAILRAIPVEAPRVDHTAVLGELAQISVAALRLDEAETWCRLALARSPDNIPTNITLALLDLLRGHFASGWRRYERRRTLVPHLPQLASPDAKPWIVPPSLAGTTVRVVLEQGMGDTLHFIRYLPLLAARGARVELAAPIHAALLPLLRGMPWLAEVVEAADSAPVPEIVVPLLSLPLAFGTSLGTIPADIPYLAPPAGRLAQWRSRLDATRPAGDSRPRIGVVWSGSPTFAHDRVRSIPLARFRRLLTRRDLDFHVLSDHLREGDAALLDDMATQHAGIADFADTAALVAAMDLVITVDTSVAHLAGALGRPVWILLPAPSDFRWLVDRDDSPWYPTARLFRQKRRLDWDFVLARVEEALRAAFP